MERRNETFMVLWRRCEEYDDDWNRASPSRATWTTNKVDPVLSDLTDDTLHRGQTKPNDVLGQQLFALHPGVSTELS